MFFTLFKKECNQLLRSITYYIYIACLVFFYFGNIGELTVSAPSPNEDFYDYRYIEEEEVIMSMALTDLAYEYDKNSFGTYPIGFYKEVILDEAERGKLADILEKTTGLPIDNILEMLYKSWEIYNIDEESYNIDAESNADQIVVEEPFELFPVTNLTYETFLIYMDEVDDILGGGSSYAAAKVHKMAKIPLTYEEVLLDYETVIEEDKISNAYARLFCDYVGIVLGILPVFLAVTRCLRDKRSKASEVIFAKKVSSSMIILPRYVATVLMAILPVFILAISPVLQCLYYGESIGAKVDGLAFITHIIGWLLPTILFSVGIGFVFTELTNSPLALLVQGVWWIVSIFMPMSYGLVGYVGWSLIPRFNTVGSREIFVKVFHQLVMNRLGYTFIAAILVAATIFIYHIKRRGKLQLYGKIIRRSKSKSEV